MTSLTTENSEAVFPVRGLGVALPGPCCPLQSLALPRAPSGNVLSKRGEAVRGDIACKSSPVCEDSPFLLAPRSRPPSHVLSPYFIADQFHRVPHNLSSAPECSPLSQGPHPVRVPPAPGLSPGWTVMSHIIHPIGTGSGRLSLRAPRSCWQSLPGSGEVGGSGGGMVSALWKLQWVWGLLNSWG